MSKPQPPIFALADDDPLPLAFNSLAGAEQYADPLDVNDGLWTFWDSNGSLLRPSGRLDEGLSRPYLVPTGESGEVRLRTVLASAMAVSASGESRYAEMAILELAEIAAAHLGISG